MFFGGENDWSPNGNNETYVARKVRRKVRVFNKETNYNHVLRFSSDSSFKKDIVFIKNKLCEIPSFTQSNLDPLLRAPQRRAERRVLEHGLQVGAVDELAEDPDLLAEVVVGDAQDADLHKKKVACKFRRCRFFL